ncbi:MAG: hypothetical protein JNJ44_03260 [Zoogloeaceae bacterium]|nr:hypothetical protein [Zoogloeaceae bacterium]
MGKWIRVFSMMAGLGGSALSAHALETVDLGIELPPPPAAHQADLAQGMVRISGAPQAPAGTWGLVPARFVGGFGSPLPSGNTSGVMAWETLTLRDTGPGGATPSGVAGWGAQLLAALAAVTVLMWRRVHSR